MGKVRGQKQRRAYLALGREVWLGATRQPAWLRHNTQRLVADVGFSWPARGTAMMMMMMWE